MVLWAARASQKAPHCLDLADPRCPLNPFPSIAGAVGLIGPGKGGMILPVQPAFDGRRALQTLQAPTVFTDCDRNKHCDGRNGDGPAVKVGALVVCAISTDFFVRSLDPLVI